ncbi:MAG: hypothetical protein ACYC1M_05190 [Armatimonadota bacterium]
MEFLIAILIAAAIVTLVYVIRLLVALRQLVITAEFRIRATTERVEATLIDADALINSVNILVNDLNAKLPGVVAQTSELLDNIQIELIPTLRHVNETTGSVSGIARILGVRMSSIDKVFSWVQVANIFKGHNSLKTKIGILGSFAMAALQAGLPYIKARPKTSGEPLL